MTVKLTRTVLLVALLLVCTGCDLVIEAMQPLPTRVPPGIWVSVTPAPTLVPPTSTLVPPTLAPPTQTLASPPTSPPTPPPTSTPTPAPGDPVAGSQEYLDDLQALLSGWDSTMTEWMTAQALGGDEVPAMTRMRYVNQAAREVIPPPEYRSVHAHILDCADHMDKALSLYTAGWYIQSTAEMDAATASLALALEELKRVHQ